MDDFLLQPKPELPDCNDTKQDIKLIPEIQYEVDDENPYYTNKPDVPPKLDVREITIKVENTAVVEVKAEPITLEHEAERKVHKCNICSYAGAQARYLKQHAKTHIPRPQKQTKQHKCEQCAYVTVSASRLKRHQQRHKDKDFKCAECDFRCKQKNSLTRHLLCHSGEKPYECKFCVYRTSRKETLKAHLRLHTGDKPFKCKDCGCAFSSSGRLCRHQQLHSDAVHRCTICGYDTPIRENLLQHVRTHTTHKCTLCPYYGSKARLKIHMTFHATAKQYHCDKCDFSDEDINLLVVHMKTHLK